METSDAAAALDSMQVVDVREPYEWAAGHLRDATHIPLRQLPNRFEEIDPEHAVLVVCQIGQRSALATEFLRKRDYDAHNLEGGLHAWTGAGHPLVSDSGGEGAVVDGWAQTIDL
jgi:rhodanese-related sulfurtransferase